MDQKGRSVGPLGGRPTSLVGRPARGPHRLSSTTWRLTIGFIGRFAKDWLQKTSSSSVAPSYKYRGGWRNETHNTPNSTHLSPLELEAFILDALVD